MAKHVLFVVHGMGKYSLTNDGAAPKTDWVKGPTRALKRGWSKYPHPTGSFDSRIKVEPITYDQIFHQYLKTLGDEGEAWKKLLEDSDIGATADFVAGLDDEDAGFLLTHVGDVLLWLNPQIRRRVLTTVQEQILDKVREYWDRDGERDTRFSMVAHSLGTSVAEEALSLLAVGKGKFRSLSIEHGSFRLEGYVALANVSRVLKSGNIYTKTRLRPPAPGVMGYVNRFVNVHHAVDPFCFAKRFRPDWHGSTFRDVRVEHVYQTDVHGFEHYLKHPAVCGQVFWAAFGTAVRKADIKAATDAFRPYGSATAAKQAKVKKFVKETERDLKKVFGSSDKKARLVGRMAARAWRNRKNLGQLGIGE